MKEPIKAKIFLINMTFCGFIGTPIMQKLLYTGKAAKKGFTDGSDSWELTFILCLYFGILISIGGVLSNRTLKRFKKNNNDFGIMFSAVFCITLIGIGFRIMPQNTNLFFLLMIAPISLGWASNFVFSMCAFWSNKK